MANTIKIGSLDISSFKVGGADCSIYLGDTKLYPEEEPFPENYRFYSKYSDGTSFSAECTSSTYIDSTTTKPSGYQASAMTDAWIGDCITSIYEMSFQNCRSLSSVTIPNSVTFIGYNAFYQCARLTSITIPNTVTMIRYAAFQNCSSLTSIAIPNGVEYIDENLFSNCSSLTSCTIGSGVTEIKYSAFERCSKLKSITIPSGVTKIGNSAFSRCRGLTSLTCLATTPPTLGSNVFYYTTSFPIYVPSESVDTYKAATNWSTYADRIQAIPT